MKHFFLNDIMKDDANAVVPLDLLVLHLTLAFLTNNTSSYGSEDSLYKGQSG